MIITVSLSCLAVLSFLPRISFSEIALSDSVAAFLELVNLTNRTCNNIEWCALRKVDNPQHERSPTVIELWYGGCSCHETCLSHKTCCPDFKISQILKDNIYLNASEFVSDILSNTSIRSMDMTIDYENDMKASDDGMECVHPRLHGRTHYTLMLPAYRMVTACSDTNVNIYLKSKCESAKYMSERSDIVEIDDVLPVQSLTTGNVYRNKYCYWCSNETNSDYKEWDIYVASYAPSMDFYKAYPLSNGDIFTTVKSADTLFDFVFEPSDNLKRRYIPQICFNIDINTCSSNNETIESYLDMACRSYLSPVFIGNLQYYTVFNNMACFYCHKDGQLEQSDKCIYFNTPIHVGKLQSQRTKDAEHPVAHYGIDGSSVDRISAFMSPRCGEGRTYDRQKEVCRHVYCPCGMVTENSTCVPVFQKISNVMIQIYISVQSQDDILNSTMASAYEQALFQYFKYEIEAYFILENLVLWRAEGTGDKTKHALFIAFSGRQTYIPFLEIVVYLKKVAHGVKRFVVSNDTLQAVLSITDSIRNVGDDAYDVAKTQKYQHVRSYKTPFAPNRFFELIYFSECHFCYRIEVSKDDYKTAGHLILIKRTGQIVTSKSISKILNTERLLICIDKVLNEVNERDNPDTSDNPDRNLLPDPDDSGEFDKISSSKTSIEKGLTTVCAFSLIAICLTLLCKFKYRQHRRITRNLNNTNQDELEMASGIGSVAETATRSVAESVLK